MRETFEGASVLAESIARTTPPGIDVRLTRVDLAGRLGLLAAGCIALRSGEAACSRCITICPTHSLHASEDSLHADDACLGCGRCAASCPTGALQAKGFNPPAPLPEGNTVRIECLKVPISITGHKAIRVPCLGGISPSTWLAIAESAAGRRVEIIDRHWCEHCSAGGNCLGEHPARFALEQAEAPLAELGWCVDRRPQIRVEPLPVNLMPDAIPLERPASHSRRALFSQLGREVRRAVSELPEEPGTKPRQLRGLPTPMPERVNLLAITRRLADAADLPMPGSLFADIHVTDACANHQLCAALCPTGALAGYDEGDTAGLSFDPAACTRCGRCAEVCPEQAIQVIPAKAPPCDANRIVITAFSERPCARCRRPFIGAALQPECPECTRSKLLGRALFGHGTPLADNQAKAPVDAVSSPGGVHHE